MKKLLTVLFALSGITVWAQDITCYSVSAPGEALIEVRTHGEAKTVSLINVSSSFSGQPVLSLRFNEQGVHTGYQEQIVGRTDRKITQILNINYDMESRPVSGEYILVDKVFLDLVCK